MKQFYVAIFLSVLMMAGSAYAVDFYPQGNVNLMNDWNIYNVRDMNTIDFNCNSCIDPSDVVDIDKDNIEGDINTFVDIAGDVMSGDLMMASNKIFEVGDLNTVNDVNIGRNLLIGHDLNIRGTIGIQADPNSLRGINFISEAASTSEKKYGLYNTLTASGLSSDAYGVRNSITGSGDESEAYGVSTSITSAGDSSNAYGVYNTLSSVGSAWGAYTTVGTTGADASAIGVYNNVRTAVGVANQNAYGVLSYIRTNDATDEGYGSYYETSCFSEGGDQYGFMANADYPTPTLDNFYAFYAKGGLLTVNTAKYGVYIKDLNSYFDGNTEFAQNVLVGGDLNAVGDSNFASLEANDAYLTNLTATGTITSRAITIFDAIPILVLKDSTYAGDTSLGYIEWRDSANTRLGFFGNSSSGNDDLYWKNESSGGHIILETTGAGEFKVFADINAQDNNITTTGTLKVNDLNALNVLVRGDINAANDFNAFTVSGGKFIGADANSVWGRSATAFGETTTAFGDYSIAGGEFSTALGLTSLAFGDHAKALGQYSTAIGYYTTASGYASAAVGEDTEAIGANSFAAGDASVSSGDDSVAMGDNCIASGTGSVCLGTLSLASSSSSIALGQRVSSTSTGSIALGYSNTAGHILASDYGTVAMGYTEEAEGWIVADRLGAVALGAVDLGGILSEGYGSLAIGYADDGNIHAGRNAWGGIAIGYADDGVIRSDGYGAIALGSGHDGLLQAAKEGAVSLGYWTKAFGKGAVAIGYDTNATGQAAVAIGENCHAKTANAVCLGKDLNAYNSNQVLVQDLNVLGTASIPAIFMQASDVSDQSFAATGTPYSIELDTVDENFGISRIEDGNILIRSTGIYSIVAQPQVTAAAGQSGTFHMWIQKDTGGGFADLSNSNVELSLGSQDEDVIILIDLTSLNSGDKIRIRASVSNTGITLDTQAPAGEPVIPSIIFSMYKIGT